MKHPKFSPAATWWIDICFLTFTLGILFFLLLDIRPLFVPDEGRYAEIAREMASSGDYITPYLNGIKYFEKPPLFYWLAALNIKLFGPTLWAVRSVNAIISLIGCLLTYCTARQLYDRLTGLLAAFILGSSLLYFVMTEMVSLDLPVTVFLAISLYAFLLGSKTSKHSYFYLSAIAAGLAVLTKGLIGLLFPCLIIGTWLFITHQWRVLRWPALFISICLFLVLVVPWHLLVSLKNPEFAYFYFIEQHFLRYSQLNIGHYQPVWFFIPCLIAGFFPWIVFLPAAIWHAHKKDPIHLFFLLWMIIIFVFFSFSKSKLIPYLLPIFPALSLLTAHYLRQVMNGHHRRGFQISCILLSLISISILYIFNQYAPLVATYLTSTLYCLLGGCLLVTCFSFYHTKKSIYILCVTTWFVLQSLLAAFLFIDTRSIKPLANILLSIMQPDDIVITYNQYYQDLPFYLQKKVNILNWKNELTYGMQHQKNHDWMINDQTFWQYWHQKNHCTYVIMDKTEYQQIKLTHPKEIFYPIADTLKNSLISNCPFSNNHT